MTNIREENSYDVIIIGAGGAGMMCAAQAGRRGRSVALIDHSGTIGRKILISGGGRCNFTNINATPANFVSKNPHFAKSALARFTPNDFITMVRDHHIRYHEKKLGQLFCDDSAEQIVDMLVAECESAYAEFILDCRVFSIEKSEESFVVKTQRGSFYCQSLVIASGGLSIPKIGATGFGYEVAKQFGLKIVPTAPALDGFTFSQEDLRHFGELSGVSLDCVVRSNGASFRENILFTHTGLSGPASLQASLYWNKSDSIEIDLLPEQDILVWLKSKRENGVRAELKNVLSDIFPKRFAEKLCEANNLDIRANQLNDRQIQELDKLLHAWRIKPEGTVGYRKAEVTRGGVDTDGLSSKTMEAKQVPGLYFIGEVVDVTGQLGGFNFQWAWASGFAAGQSV